MLAKCSWAMRDLASPPSLAELMQVRDDDVAQGRRQREVRQQTVEHRLRGAFVEVVERALQRACELVQVESDRPVGHERDVRRRERRVCASAIAVRAASAADNPWARWNCMRRTRRSSRVGVEPETAG